MNFNIVSICVTFAVVLALGGCTAEKTATPDATEKSGKVHPTPKKHYASSEVSATSEQKVVLKIRWRQIGTIDRPPFVVHMSQEQARSLAKKLNEAAGNSADVEEGKEAQ